MTATLERPDTHCTICDLHQLDEWPSDGVNLSLVGKLLHARAAYPDICALTCISRISTMAAKDRGGLKKQVGL